jgi:hypothetical protein
VSTVSETAPRLPLDALVELTETSLAVQRYVSLRALWDAAMADDADQAGASALAAAVESALTAARERVGTGAAVFAEHAHTLNRRFSAAAGSAPLDGLARLAGIKDDDFAGAAYAVARAFADGPAPPSAPSELVTGEVPPPLTVSRHDPFCTAILYLAMEAGAHCTHSDHSGCAGLHHWQAVWREYRCH